MASELLLRAVIVFESGVRVLLAGGGEGLVSREARGLRLPLDLCESFPDFFADFSESRLSLFITSAKALPTEAKFYIKRVVAVVRQ